MSKSQTSNIPAEYQFLLEEKYPYILIKALELYGIKEKPGPQDNPVILEWAEEVKEYLGAPYQHDSIPWCGLFMAVCAKRAGYTPPKIAIRAKEWAKFGAPSDVPKLGDILVFNRAGGGHVGLYVGEDQDFFYVLGANQKDSVCIVKIRKDRLVCARQCRWKVAQPPTLRRIFIDTKANISNNEA